MLPVTKPRTLGCVGLCARVAEEKQCVLVDVGADEYGRKELLAMTDGLRKSSQSWREVLLDLRFRSFPQIANVLNAGCDRSIAISRWMSALGREREDMGEKCGYVAVFAFIISYG